MGPASAALRMDRVALVVLLPGPHCSPHPSKVPKAVSPHLPAGDSHSEIGGRGGSRTLVSGQMPRQVDVRSGAFLPPPPRCFSPEQRNWDPGQQRRAGAFLLSTSRPCQQESQAERLITRWRPEHPRRRSQTGRGSRRLRQRTGPCHSRWRLTVRWVFYGANHHPRHELSGRFS